MRSRPVPGTSSGILLERSGQLALSADLAAWAAPGQARGLLLTGPAGIGKSALMAAWTERARDGGTTVWRAGCSELEQAAPYAVLRRLLARPLAEADGRALDALAAGPAGLAVDLVRGVDPDGAVPIDPARVVHGFFWLVDALAEPGPVLLAVDDVHWADEASLRVLEMLADRLDELPLTMAVASRDIPPLWRSTGLARLFGHPALTPVHPPPLTERATAHLLSTATGAPVGEEFARQCHDATGGNPFLAVELASFLAERGVATDDDHARTVRDLVPASVVDAVVRRMASLSPDVHTLARAVAVLESAPLRLAAECAGLATEAAASAADQMRAAALLRPEAPLAYRHSLLRTAVLDAMGADERAALRRAAARLLVREPDGLLPAAAQLLATEGTGDPEAVRILEAAARSAAAAAAPGQAVTLLRRAVAEPPGADELAAVLLALGEAQLMLGDPAGVHTLQQAIAVERDPRARATAAMTLAAALDFGGDYEGSAAALEAVLPDLEPGSDEALLVEAGLVQSSLQVPLRVDWARQRLRSGPPRTGATLGERRLLTQEAAVGNATSAPAAQVVAAARLAIGEPHVAQQPDDHDWSIVRLHLAAAGEYDEVVASCDAAVPLVTRTGSTPGFVAVNLVRGYARLWGGSVRDAEGDLRACERILDGVAGGNIAATMARAGLVESLLAQGSAREAAALADLDHGVDGASFHGGINLLRARALARTALGDPRGALDEVAECRLRLEQIRIDNPPWCNWRQVAIAAHRGTGDREEAMALAEQELAQAERREDGVQRGVALRWKGLLANGPDQAVLLTESVEALQQTQARLELHRSELALGAALRRGGRRAEAREWLMRARAGAWRCGAAGLMAHAGSELTASGGRPRRLPVDGVGALTPSERRVCDLAAQGLRNREIAQSLFLSPKTVEIHLSRSFRKLGIGNRGALPEALADTPHPDESTAGELRAGEPQT